MSAALQHPIGPYTIEDWLTLPESTDGSRTELIFGHLHMTPPPGGGHQRVTGRLQRFLEDAVRAAQRKDLHAVLGVGVEISSALRTALIPDVVIMDQDPELGASFPAESLVLVVEVWSPGSTRAERETKMAAYASAGVPFLWALEQQDGLELTTYRLVRNRYRAQDTVRQGDPVTVEAAPVPITVDLNSLLGW